MHKKKCILFAGIFMFSLFFNYVSAHSQEHPDYTITQQVNTTSVKDQEKSGTCWSYATISFIETEALRKGQSKLNLSEMFPVRFAYQQKARDYVRFHGNNNFSQGGQAHDVMHVIQEHGIVPQKVYRGLNYGTDHNDHREMAAILKSMSDAVVNLNTDKLTTAWDDAISSVLDTYLGEVPEKFNYEGTAYTPVEFAKDVVNINPADYVELTSFGHHDYYTAFDLEVPDNWSHDLYYNIPADELMSVMENALKNGYSVCWDGDVSEPKFRHKKGEALLQSEDKKALEQNPEKHRLHTFNNMTTTDDHLMHITGLAEDDADETFYLTKNSWNKNSNDYGGYLYMSAEYVKLKTIAIMVHKDAIPEDIADKLF